LSRKQRAALPSEVFQDRTYSRTSKVSTANGPRNSTVR
jgi:hypothetical protein